MHFVCFLFFISLTSVSPFHLNYFNDEIKPICFPSDCFCYIIAHFSIYILRVIKSNKFNYYFQYTFFFRCCYRIDSHVLLLIWCGYTGHELFFLSLSRLFHKCNWFQKNAKKSTS